ncbi:phosphatidylinositol phospholipase C, beta [Paragonimus westermani]|uniref:Phosphoinositide phospholipase C n=1 Tax=Paragonimus westermani TaxID=34504 RepID=A0A5J4NHC9_9TREM|nr:phosphatidylinositol phospholipase C, beta [Paragonimus westermani]
MRYRKTGSMDMIFNSTNFSYFLEAGVPLPPPEKLKRKILIKNKRLKPEVEKQQLELFLKGQTDAIQEENEVSEDPDLTVDDDIDNGTRVGNGDSYGPVTPGSTSSGVTVAVSPAGGGSSADLKRLQLKKGSLTAEEEQIMMAQYHHTGATSSIHPLLSSFINYAQPVKFQGFDVAEVQIVLFILCFSIYLQFRCYVLDYAIYASYNKRQMSRIYPRGNRVDSSNYMPQIFWNAGCQMVALNFQTPDLAMQLNQGKFEYNGNCGYLLKPEFMRRPERQFDPFSESPMDGVIAATCEVKIISGQFLSDRKVGTYVEVDMYGLPTDTIRKEFRTRVVPNNGLNPVYGEDAVFVFRKVVLPDLAVLRFAVYEETGKLIGQRVIPLDGLQAGYRHISLRTEGNFPLSLPTLFCQVNLTTYVPEGLNDLVDALSDPRAFLSKEEQRMKQLASMGIDSSEIADVPATANAKRTAGTGSSGTGLGISGSSGTSGAGDTIGSNSTKKEDKKDDPKFDPISLTLLQTDKNYQKLIKKQSKELETIQRRHEKDAIVMLRNHTTVTEKLSASHAKERSNSKRPVKTENGQGCSLEDSQKSQICELTRQQKEQWTGLKVAQMREIYELVLGYIEARKELLLKVMKEVQEEQKRELKIVQEREIKEMKAQQTKASIESSRSVMNDRKLRNKAERDRRIRELNDYNTKRFIDQRKVQAQRHEKQNQELNKRHAKEGQDILVVMRKERDDFMRKYEEDLLAVKCATVI